MWFFCIFYTFSSFFFIFRFHSNFLLLFVLISILFTCFSFKTMNLLKTIQSFNHFPLCLCLTHESNTQTAETSPDAYSLHIIVHVYAIRYENNQLQVRFKAERMPLKHTIFFTSQWFRVGQFSVCHPISWKPWN